MNPQDLRLTILLSLQRALLGEIFPAMRDFSVRGQDERIHLTCVTEHELSEEEQESLWCIETELLADLPSSYEVENHVLVVPTSAKIPRCEFGVPVYSRREDI